MLSIHKVKRSEVEWGRVFKYFESQDISESMYFILFIWLELMQND